MPTYNDTSSYDGFSIGLGPVARRPIIRKNIDAFATAMEKIGNAHMEAIKQRSAIDVALAQVELDHSEDEWKFNYTQRIKDKIDNAAMFGSYSTALSTATKMAAEAVSSPELIGRQRAHQDHQERLKEVKNNQNIDAEIREYWEDTNPYYYEDNIDPNTGRVIGGSKWKENWTPQETVSLNQLVASAIQLTAEDRTSTSNEVQSSVGNADGSGSGSLKADEFSVQSKDVPSMTKMFRAMMANSPDAQRYLSQLRSAKIHKIEKLKEKLNTTSGAEREKLRLDIATREQELMNKQGTGYVSEEEFYMRNVNPMLEEAAYRHTSTATRRHSSSQAATSTGGGGGGRRGSGSAGGGDDYSLLETMLGQGNSTTSNPVEIAYRLAPLVNEITNIASGAQDLVERTQTDN